MNRLQELRRQREKEVSESDDSDYSFDLHVTDANKKDVIETMVGPKYQIGLPDINVYKKPSRIDTLKPVWNPDEVDDSYLSDFFSELTETLKLEITHHEQALAWLTKENYIKEKVIEEAKNNPDGFKE